MCVRVRLRRQNLDLSLAQAGAGLGKFLRANADMRMTGRLRWRAAAQRVARVSLGQLLTRLSPPVTPRREENEAEPVRAALRPVRNLVRLGHAKKAKRHTHSLCLAFFSTLPRSTTSYKDPSASFLIAQDHYTHPIQPAIVPPCSTSRRPTHWSTRPYAVSCWSVYLPATRSATR